MASKDCPICCEPFNKSTRVPITCECTDCNFAACKGCTRTYLLSQTNDPSCMDCHKAWSQRFLTSSLNSSFINGDFKKHRAKLLREREQARLQDSVTAAQQLLESEQMADEEKTLTQRIGELHQELARAKRLRDRLRTRRWALARGIGHEDDDQGKKQFVVSCPSEGCRGFLSTQWKCGLCNLHACRHCLEIIGLSKDDPHTCKPENIASAELIRKETRPCPACGARIHKLEGCDQMWCTECHVVFSWRTGKRTNGIVHNPHYLEWQRATRGEGATRAVGDVPCGGLVGHYSLTYGIMDSGPGSLGRWLRNQSSHTCKLVQEKLAIRPECLYIGLREMHAVAHAIVVRELPYMRRQVQELEDFGHHRVQYLLKRTDLSQFEKAVYSQDQKRRKTLQVLHIMELLGTVMTETFRDMEQYCKEINERKRRVFDAETSAHPIYQQLSQSGMVKDLNSLMVNHLRQHDYPRGGRGQCLTLANIVLTCMLAKSMERMESVIAYCNGQFADVSVAFALTVPHIKSEGHQWRFESMSKLLEADPDFDTMTMPRRIGIYALGSQKFTRTQATSLREPVPTPATENVKI